MDRESIYSTQRIQERDISVRLDRQLYLLKFMTGMMVPVLLMMTIALILPSVRDLTRAHIENLELSNQALSTLPDIEQRVSNLSRSIEQLSNSEFGNRLNTIEDLLSSGNLDEKQISDFASLQSNVNSLNELVNDNPGQIIELKSLIDDVVGMKPRVDASVSADTLNREIESLRFVLNMLMAVGALLFTILAGFIVAPTFFNKKTDREEAANLD